MSVRLAKAPRAPFVERIDHVIELCRGTRVLHLGATDSPVHAERAASGELLHQRLKDVASALLGYDIDADAIAQLAKQHDITDIVEGDIHHADTDARVAEFKPQVILAAEIIEHLGNPQAALETLGRVMQAHDAVTVITIPNAFNLTNLGTTMLLSSEYLNPDHTYWPSYSTFCVLLDRAGLRVRDFCWYQARPTNRMRRLVYPIMRWIPRLRPCLADGMIFVVEPTADTTPTSD